MSILDRISEWQARRAFRRLPQAQQRLMVMRNRTSAGWAEPAKFEAKPEVRCGWGWIMAALFGAAWWWLAILAMSAAARYLGTVAP